MSTADQLVSKRRRRSSNDELLDNILAPYIDAKVYNDIRNGVIQLPTVGLQFFKKRMIHKGNDNNSYNPHPVRIGRSSNEMLAAFNMIVMAE